MAAIVLVSVPNAPASTRRQGSEKGPRQEVSVKAMEAQKHEQTEPVIDLLIYISKTPQTLIVTTEAPLLAQVQPNIVAFGAALSACEKGQRWMQALGMLRGLRGSARKQWPVQRPGRQDRQTGLEGAPNGVLAICGSVYCCSNKVERYVAVRKFELLSRSCSCSRLNSRSVIRITGAVTKDSKNYGLDGIRGRKKALQIVSTCWGSPIQGSFRFEGQRA